METDVYPYHPYRLYDQQSRPYSHALWEVASGTDCLPDHAAGGEMGTCTSAVAAGAAICRQQACEADSANPRDPYRDVGEAAYVNQNDHGGVEGERAGGTPLFLARENGLGVCTSADGDGRYHSSAYQ